MIECDSSEITSDRIRSLLYEIGENLIKSNEFEIQSKSATKPGDNYIGIVHRVTYERKNDKNQIQANNLSTIILKTTPTNPVRREAFGSRNFFLREIYVYNDLLSYFEQFQRSKQIDIPKDGFTEYARCYRTIDVEPDECILLEDLSVNGFSMIDKQKEVITADHVKLVMQVMGKFHAISFAIKHQEPDKFKEIIANLGEVCFHSGNDIFRKFFCVLQKQTMDAITGTELMEKCDKIIEESFFDVVVKSVIGEPAEPFAIICHGDCWSNNNLFKYDENGKPIEVCLIDWQVTRYASPATDILYYIFGCVGKELRVSNYDIFLKTYYESLSSYLKRLGSDPEKLFPYEALLDQLRKFSKFGLAIGSMMSKAMITDETEATNLDEASEKFATDVEWNTNEIIPRRWAKKFNERMKDLVYDMVRLNYI